VPFGCIYVPDFPVQASLRRESKAQPVALLDGPESLLKVVACNKPARRAGVSAGMTKLQAEVCRVSLRKRVQEDEDAAQFALLECAYRFSPRAEATLPGTIIADLTGTERLSGTGETVGLRMAALCRASGFDGNVGIASNPDTALCAARGFAGITIIAPGEEEQRLGCLPIKVLEPSPETVGILDAWGIRNFKALAALPSIALTQRLGQHGLHLQRLAQGAIYRELVPAEPPTSFQESMELEEPVELLEPLSFILNRLLEQLMEHLAARSLATDNVGLSLSLEVHPDRDVQAVMPAGSVTALLQRTVKLPVPIQDAKVLLRLLQLDLAAHPPHAPVKKIKIEAIPARIRYTQAGLFQPLAPEPAQLEIATARIRAVVGECDHAGRHRVGFPAVTDSHRPDSFQVMPEQKHSKTVPQPAMAACLALRLFRPALPARVELSAEHAPLWIVFQRRKARIVHASGPWRRGGEWWDAAGEWLREDWDVHIRVEDAAGVYRIFRDLRTGQWFVEGMYD
jgi:protein ImuB